jgi:hypothetical protein
MTVSDIKNKTVPSTDEDEQNYHEDDEVAALKHHKVIEEGMKMANKISEALVQRDVGEEEETEQESKKRKKASGLLSVSAKRVKAASVPAIDESMKSSQEGTIKTPPTKEMTGVDPILTRVCAALSGQIYHVKSAEDFKLSTDEVEVEVVLFDDHGKLAETTPPLVIAVTCDTMILGWRGSSTLMDFIMDVAFVPVASSKWLHTAKSVRAQGGFCALVESDLSIHQDTIIELIKSRGIKQLLLTGHSLAGGVAQVAHLFLEGARSDDGSVWSTLRNLKVRSIAFSAPMTTVNIDRKNDAKSVQFLNKVGAEMCNIIYESDPVPRGYANLTFINKLVENALPQVIKGLPIPRAFKWALKFAGVPGKVGDFVENKIASQSELFKVAEAYRHIGKIVYYEDAEATPLVYIDKGFHFDKPEGSTDNLFYDIPYIPSDNVYESVMTNHMFLVTGPGLAYNVDRDKL